MSKLTIILFFAMTAFTSLFAAPRVVLFNDTSAWYHWGCTGTSTALKEGIEKLGWEIQVFPISHTYALKDVPQFDDFKDLQKYELFCATNEETIDAIKRADAVVITGEGTIHDLRNGPRALLYLTYISKMLLKKHVEIINHSAYPKDDPSLSANFINNFAVEKEKAEQELTLAQFIYNAIYAQLDFIAIREPFSQKEMNKIGISSTLSFDCLPLYIRDHYHKKKLITEKTVVISGSVAHSEEGVEKLSRYLEILASQGFKIQVLIGAAAFPSKDEQTFVNLMKTHCHADLQLIDAKSMEEWLDTINQATLFVSGRFHHSIAAFCLNTPFIALNSSTYKVHGICSIMVQPEPLLYSDPNLLDSLLKRTQTIMSSPVVNNDDKIAELRKLAERNFDGLRLLFQSL